MPKLVIVESPAKANTIGRFLGKEYEVHASYGHVRDLPENASEVPAEYRKQKWATLGVNVENDFEPLYIVPDDKKRHVDSLKKAAKGVDEILLATDEDREGESISWHVLKILNPAKKVPVRRIVFHEITPEAIQAALRNPRDLDENLVRAQETRRVLDRLYGYTLSPLLWRKVAPKLSAGRVQSVAVRLCVMRERERAKFQASVYWDLEAELGTDQGKLTAKLIRVDGNRLATGKSFSLEGEHQDKSLWLKEADARDLLGRTENAKPWKVSAIETKQVSESAPPPFMTSTLQQEAARKLRFTSRRTMQIAQTLYEGVELGGERVGLITYMRTDSLSLADRALDETRAEIQKLYGSEYLPSKPIRYKTKSKGAQEAHEAIRPVDMSRHPNDVRRYLSDEQFHLYELIWKRTLACQMVPARIRRTQVEITVNNGKETLDFSASGKIIEFPGYLRAYVEGQEDPEAALDQQERILPPLEEGKVLDLLGLGAESHTTQPPARYTEASLVKKLEEEGIGRPSTYASIMSTIQDRGYIFKRGNELIPTYTAFAVTGLLEDNFDRLVDVKFTAKMEDELDEIAEGDRDHVGYLKNFYLGSKSDPGLEETVTKKAPEIPFPAHPIGTDPKTGEPVVVRIGRFGAYLQRGAGGKGNQTSIPAELPPADLTIEKAVEILNLGGGGAAIAEDPASGLPVYAKTGRFGDYLEVALPEGSPEDAKPKRITLPPGMKAAQVTAEDAALLVRFPIQLGKSSEFGAVEVLMGRYGPYLKAGETLRNLSNWRDAGDLSLEDAEEILRKPAERRGKAAASTPREALRELTSGKDTLKIFDGRYGPYVTDGTTNASLPKGLDPGDLTVEKALELLKERAGAPKRKGASGRRKPAAKKTRSGR